MGHPSRLTARREFRRFRDIGFMPAPFSLFPVSGGKGPFISYEKERFV